MNRVVLFGNLGQDPEIKTLENGVLVARFSLATSENFQQNGEWHNRTEWHNIVVWRAQAERAEKQLKKGDSIVLEGKISYKKYTDREGIERVMTQITADFFTKAKGSSKSREAEEWPSESDAPPARQRGPVEAPSAVEAEAVTASANDDLPF